jgi:hypothetical protein
MKPIWILMALAAQLLAQRSEVVRVQHQPVQIMNLLKPMIPEGTKVAFDDQLKVITLNGTPEVVEMLMNNIRRLDVTPSMKSIELTVQLLLGSETDGKVPDELNAVVKQLRATFPFKGYQLLDSNVQRALDGKRSALDGVLPGPAEFPAATYRMDFTTASVLGEGAGRQVSLAGLKFTSRYPYEIGTSPTGTGPGPRQFQFGGAEFYTDVVLREGQKIVIGKSSLGHGKESLFGVLSAKVVE